jgi:thioredoxin-like negative regulator of GroEL
MRKRSINRFRKRRASTVNDQNPQSTVLRTLRDLIQRGNYAVALTQINSLVDTYTGEMKLKLLALAGDSLFKRGNFSAAAQAYATIYQSAISESLDWLRPGIGQIRSLLKVGQTTQAIAQSVVLTSQTVAAQQQYQQRLTQADLILAAGGQAIIPARPPGIDTVSSRLGRLFLAEGETGTAKNLFQAAVQVNPSHCQAKLGLAEIALRENRPGDAESLLRDAISLNQNNADTIAAWPLLVSACKETGNDPLSSNLVNGLAQATPSVRARATLVLTRSLRANNDSRWQIVSTNWLQNFSSDNVVVPVELNKLTVATDRQTGQSAAQCLQDAQALLASPGLGPQEWLSAAKELVRARFTNKIDPQIDSLINQVPDTIPSGFKIAVIHGLARACHNAERFDLALALYQRNASSQAATTKWWGKAVWNMGKIKQTQGDTTAAAALFWQFYQQTAQPQRLRYYALTEWARLINSNGQSGGTATVKTQIAAALPSLTDYELVLDLARQVKISAFGAALAETAFQKGLQLAMQAFNASTHPAPAATILFKLCRRANDFAHYDAIIATWTALTDAQKQWLWSTRSDYWSYLELVFRAYRDSGRLSEAERFATPFLNDAGTPPEGYAAIAASYAAMKRGQGNLATMFLVYRKMIQTAPTFEWTSVAYYWFALQAWKQGSVMQAGVYANQILLALGKDSGLQWKQDMATAAWCLKSGLDASQIPVSFSPVQVQLQLAVIQKDLTKL